MGPDAAARNHADLTWSSPQKGHWRRDFRYGEWLSDPVTPLFATWFLPEAEDGYNDAIDRYYGARMQLPLHVLVNGWYFTNPGRIANPLSVLRHPILYGGQMLALATVATRPGLGERTMAIPGGQMFDDLLPLYRDAVAAAEATVASASPTELRAIVSSVARAAGTIQLPVVMRLGFAGKAECALAVFYDKHLRSKIGGTHQTLLGGLVPPTPPAAHAVTSIDWSNPTLGELGLPRPTYAGFDDAVTARKEAEQRCREALDGRALATFERDLDLAQRYSVVREEMGATLTIGWPVMRAAIARLDRGEDVWFHTRDELDGPLVDVSDRRRIWEDQRQLAPPLGIGKANGPWRKADAMAAPFRSAPLGDTHLLAGMPASPGVATGTVRIVRGPEDFDRVQDGDVLVAPITAPAWTPMFAFVSAVITDGGSLFAHTPLVAREYGIPCVVGTGNATSALIDGMTVTVDGDRGVIDRA